MVLNPTAIIPLVEVEEVLAKYRFTPEELVNQPVAIIPVLDLRPLTMLHIISTVAPVLWQPAG